VLKERVITGIIMAAAVLAAIVFLPPVALMALMALIFLMAAWEWADLSGLQVYPAKAAYVLLVAALMTAVGWYGELLSAMVEWLKLRDVIGAGCLWWAIALLWVKSYPASSLLWGSVVVRALMGLLVIIPTWLALVYLRWQEGGVALILILIAFTSCADSGAYFSGKRWGKSKLAPNVSPGKSWAGFWGGLAVSNLFAVGVWFALGQPLLSLGQLLTIAPLVFAVSVLGDLLESMVKRHRGVKDSGVILPGHGGILDRVDSLTAAAPVFALSLMLVAQHG
jgi:phosphatidate cytidylyltransferase